jgi:catechol 2,3-dioxygenase-like lactoylglutathione lyase family enzyme
MKVCQTTIHVSDLQKALDFYHNKLGFDILNESQQPPVVVLKHDGFPIVLHQVAGSAPIDYGNTNHTVLAFQTDDIGQTYADLKKKGVDFIHPAPQPFPVGQMAAFRDPSGNILELIQFQFPN